MNFELPSCTIDNDQDNRDDNPTEEQRDRLFSTAVALVKATASNSCDSMDDVGVDLPVDDQDWASIELQQYIDAFEV